MTLVPSDLLEPLVLLACLARTERTEKLVLVDHVVIVALKVCVVSLVLLAHKVSRVRREPKAALDPVVSKVFKDQRETLETVDPRALVEVEPLDPRDLKESKDPREAVELLVHVLVVQLDPWELVVSVERWASKARRETLAHLDLKELVAAMVSRETVVPLDPWAALVCVVPRVTRVSTA